jgi:mannosyltransferase
VTVSNLPGTTGRQRIYLCAILATGFALRLYRLDAQSLWFDEGFALHLSSQSLGRLIEQNPVGWLPLHSAVLHSWLLVGGRSPFSARFLSVVFGMLVLALLYVFGRRLGKGGTGTIASVLGAFSPFLIYYAQEARVYSLWVFLSLLSSYLLLRALGNSRQLWRWASYWMALVGALYAHYFSIFLLPWGMAAISYRAVHDRSKHVFAAGSCCLAAALLACVPLIGFARSSAADSYGFWRSPLASRQVVIDLWYHFTTGGNLTRQEGLPAMLTLAAVAAAGLLFLRPRWNAVLVGIYVVLPVLGMLALSSWRELYVSRYLAIVVPAGYVLAARGVTWLMSMLRRPGMAVRGVAAAALALITAAVAPAWAGALNNYYFSPQYTRDDFRSAALYVSSEEREGDVIVMSGGGISTAFMPYYDGKLPVVDLPWFGEWLDEKQVVSTLNDQLAGQSDARVWLVLSGNEITDPQNLITAHLWTYGTAVDARSFPGRTGVRVVLFSPREEIRDFRFAELEYQPVRADFEDQVELTGYEIDEVRPVPGEEVHLALRWRALASLREDYHSFVHLLGDGNLVAGHDKVPLNQYFRPTAWPVDELLRDEYVLALPDGLAPGAYQVEVGLYSYPAMERLHVVGGDFSGDDRVLLTSIIVGS